MSEPEPMSHDDDEPDHSLSSSDEDWNDHAEPEAGPSRSPVGRRRKSTPKKRKASRSPSIRHRAMTKSTKKRAKETEPILDSVEMVLPVVPVATADDLYYPSVQYFNLGYVTNSLASQGVAENAWNCRCYSFAFVMDPVMFAGLKTEVRESRMRVLRQVRFPSEKTLVKVYMYQINQSINQINPYKLSRAFNQAINRSNQPIQIISGFQSINQPFEGPICHIQPGELRQHKKPSASKFFFQTTYFDVNDNA